MLRFATRALRYARPIFKRHVIFTHLAVLTSCFGVSSIVYAEKSRNGDKAKSVDMRSKHGIDDVASCQKSRNAGWTPLHVAAAENDVEAMRRLLTRIAQGTMNPVAQPSDINARDTFDFDAAPPTAVAWRLEQKFPALSTTGATPLHFAVYRQSLEMIELLLEAGADWTIKDNYNLLPQDYAAGAPKAFHDEYNRLIRNKKQMAERVRRREFPIERQLEEHIVGQKAAIHAVASAIRRRENGWHDDKRPLVFLFLGSSGIGKTEMAKQIAHYLHKDDEKAFIRFDMSEFQGKHEVAKFIGSPPGYIGYEEGGQLTSRLRECKSDNVVLLFDEIEKCHPDVLTIMLQLFDEGRITDGRGQTVDCSNAVVIMTSNLGQKEIANAAELLRSNDTVSVNSLRLPVEMSHAPEIALPDEKQPDVVRHFMDHTIYPILRQHFKRDEFLGRIDDMLLFTPFTDEELKEIVVRDLKHWAERAKSRHSLTLTWSDSLVDRLSRAYNKNYGARSIRHAVERCVAGALADAHERALFSEGDAVHLDVSRLEDGGEMVQVSTMRQRDTESTWSRLWRGKKSEDKNDLH